MVAVVLVFGIKFFRGTVKEWFVPFRDDGELLIEKIQYLEFLVAKSKYRKNENVSDGMLGDEIKEIGPHVMELKSSHGAVA